MMGPERRAKLALSMDELHEGLLLPPDVKVWGVHVTHDPEVLYVLLECERFAPQPVDTESPLVRYGDL